MNCDDYLSMLEMRPVTEVASRLAHEHAAECRECSRVTRIVAAHESNTLAPAGDLVSTALAAERHRKVTLYYRLGLVCATVASVFVLLLYRNAPVPPTGPITHEAFRLQCMSPAQAAEVLRPLVGVTGKIWFNPDSPLGILNVEGPPEVMKVARSAIDRYDNSERSQCAVQVRVPKPQ